MDIDWEVEIGGGAPVIEALWPGFIDLRTHPERIGEIAETSAFAPLADLLISLNSPQSPIWTSKCDVWEPEPGGAACYVDLIPRHGSVFADWRCVERLCRALVKQMTTRNARDESDAAGTDATIADAPVSLVIRQAIAGQAEGYGITAYFSAGAESLPDAATVVANAMVAFSNAIRSAAFLDAPDQS
jgi:hypothetical protein